MSPKRLLLGLILCTLGQSAVAEVKATNPWVRATVPAQRATGAFVELVADTPSRLVQRTLAGCRRRRDS